MIQPTRPRTYFEIDFADAGRYVWRIRRVGDNTVLSTSEVMPSHDACMAAIGVVFQDAGRSPLKDRTRSR